ncbi:unnamed protein product [Scytosiphon promiscuus]
MGQQQQQQPTQQQLQPSLNHVHKLPPALAPMGMQTTADVGRRNSYSEGDASQVARKAMNRWKELAPEDFVIGYSRGLGRARCSTCGSKIARGQLQLGAFYMHEDKFTLLRWHHQRCVDAPDCLRLQPHEHDLRAAAAAASAPEMPGNPEKWEVTNLTGIEDLAHEDRDEVREWLGYGAASTERATSPRIVKDRTWTTGQLDYN